VAAVEAVIRRVSKDEKCIAEIREETIGKKC
jgi:hypothetical protein